MGLNKVSDRMGAGEEPSLAAQGSVHTRPLWLTALGDWKVEPLLGDKARSVSWRWKWTSPASIRHAFKGTSLRWLKYFPSLSQILFSFLGW